MKKDTSDFFEEDIMENELAEALEQEQTALLEIELEKETKSAAPEIPETSTRKKLKRELEREALSRLEDAARTEEDFQNVITWWNRLDANRERKERYHEIGRSDVPLEWGMSPDEIVIPAPIQHVYQKQIQKGDFLDAVFNCPFEMHELVTDADISKAIFALKDVQKELLYQFAIRGYSCQMIASFRKQTDRNIRKIRDTMFTDDTVVVRLGDQYLRSYIWDTILAGIHFSFSGYFCAYGLSAISFIHNVLSILCVRIPGAYLASVYYPDTLYPMGLAAPGGSLLSVLICVIAFVVMKKRRHV